ncbi:hypothetical protein FACS1894132_09810 [Clostridia bacterium]|nr:hypothetical protein FACS1894132_09810 [Clostridia bacterium]
MEKTIKEIVNLIEGLPESQIEKIYFMVQGVNILLKAPNVSAQTDDYDDYSQSISKDPLFDYENTDNDYPASDEEPFDDYETDKSTKAIDFGFKIPLPSNV